MSQDVMICVMNSTAVFDNVNLEMNNGEFYVKCVDLDTDLLSKQNAYTDLSKSYSQLEKHCISLELTMQLNQEIFQKDTYSDNKNDLEIPENFENNDLKAQLQAKDTTIYKLKSMENADLKGQIQEKDVQLDLDPFAPRLLKNRDAHIEYLKYTQEQAYILQGIVEQAKEKQPLDNALDFACKHAKQIQELLTYVRHTCPTANKPSEKLVAVTPMNKVKKVRFQNLSHPQATFINSEDLGKLNAKADIGIFIGYAPAKKAFRIYIKRTWKIMETIYVTFNKLTAMDFEQFSSGPRLQSMTPTTSCSGLVPNPVP
ncbi:hypothetical protein Tco_0594090 [Tanacetum coccineum]